MPKRLLKRAWAVIHTDRLKRNIEKIKNLLPQDTQLMCVVKANCYGHGIEKLIPCMQDECGVDWFAVSNLIEAQELRDLGVTGEILILGYTPPENAPELIEYDIIQAVTSLEYATELSIKCPIGERVRTHIAIDTGMSRIGMRGEVSDICDDIQKAVKLERVSLEGIFTHFAVADSESADDINFTQSQADMLNSVKDELNRRLIVLEQVHMLNSAGTAIHSHIKSSLARVGIMLYGLTPDPSITLPYELEPVMELKACVSQVKIIPSGTTVSYGRTYTTDKDTTVAVVSIGYADGYPRLLSNKASVLIKGKRARILGRICMDQMMIDITAIEGVKEGDIVTLIGKDGNEEITADEVAAYAQTISYEIVCGISPRVPRIDG